MKRSGGDRHHEHDYGGCHLLVLVVGDEASGDSIDSTGAWGERGSSSFKFDKSDPSPYKNVYYVQGRTKKYYLVPRMAFSKDFRKATRGLEGAIVVVRDLAIPDLICS